MRTGRYRLGGLGTALFLCAAVVTVATGTARASAPTTAWRAGAFSVNVPNLVRRADVVLGAPNAKPEQAMPVGNGVLGAAVWAAGGFTAQLNRSDTQPLRWSPGWLTIPGLARLTETLRTSDDFFPGDLVVIQDTGEGDILCLATSRMNADNASV